LDKELSENYPEDWGAEEKRIAPEIIGGKMSDAL
jgi:hypothetical protein